MILEKCDKCHEVVFDSHDEKRFQNTKIINDMTLCENCQEFVTDHEDYRTDLD